MTQNKQMGRPSKYPGDEKVKELVTLYIADTLKKERIPSKAGLAVYLDIDKQTVLNWMEQHTEFFGACKKLEAYQEVELINGKNTTMAIFLLKNNHGYKDKSEIDTNTTIEWKEERYGEDT